MARAKAVLANCLAPRLLVAVPAVVVCELFRLCLASSGQILLLIFYAFLSIAIPLTLQNALTLSWAYRVRVGLARRVSWPVGSGSVRIPTRLWNQCMRFNCSRLHYPVRHSCTPYPTDLVRAAEVYLFFSSDALFWLKCCVKIGGFRFGNSFSHLPL